MSDEVVVSLTTGPEGDLVANAELGGTVPMWGWIGDEAATTFGY